MKDAQIQNSLAKLMLGGTLLAASIIAAGLIWYLSAHPGDPPGDHIYSGEPKYFENLSSMVRRAFDLKEIGHRRSVIMIGIVLLLLNPLVRVAFAAVGFSLQRDRLYAGISLLVLLILLLSFF